LMDALPAVWAAVDVVLGFLLCQYVDELAVVCPVWDVELEKLLRQ
jgi:hypothetical protein